MKLKIFATIGLIFLILNQVMLLGGHEFIQNQQPIDYAHWLLLIGALLCLSLNYIFSDNIFSNVATILTSLGIVALIGQSTIDFLWWSYGTDFKGMDKLTTQIMERPSIRIPFMTIGPALFYFGLATHAGKFIRTHPLWPILTFIGVIGIGLGAFTFDSRILIVLGHILLTLGLVVLILKKESAPPIVSE
ncbi:hypothetical protein U6A24_19965 [Aquimarina gracilis]|uniref:Uncharacterized protein n=1 Tax=Aquimarina gracilis TaxID=874422 RepID=A0ABU6A0W8_9FLAO|nr:hypothetical protein [Aquimarina gracilis]MEB3347764.1 hypothetical protein [Aquimarina gracilis]